MVAGSGSFYGGTRVTIAGAGLGPSTDMNAASVGGAPCEVTAASNDQIVCPGVRRDMGLKSMGRWRKIVGDPWISYSFQWFSMGFNGFQWLSMGSVDRSDLDLSF